MLKWVGGKTKVLPFILDRLPNGCERYIEPFLGGGAVYLAIKDRFNECYISDLNPRLMNFYNACGQEVSVANAQPLVESTLRQVNLSLYNTICVYIEAYNKSQDKAKYYDVQRTVVNRDDYAWLEGCEVYFTPTNLIIKPDLERGFKGINVEDATSFYIVNHTCFNGLYRENKKGQFNVPFGKYKHLGELDKTEFEAYCKCFCSSNTTQVHIGCYGYDKSLEHVNDKTFVYLDPPYRPISNTASFTAYQKSGFNDDQQRELKEYCDEVNRRGGKFLLSNSYQEDGFFQELYKDYTIDVIEVMRTISAKGDSRGVTKEILVRNY